MNQYLRQVVTSGTGGSANFSGMTVAGKTGTTTDNYDRYFVGYTPYYVAAVWTGYEVNVKINASGNPSAQLFRKVMSKVHENLPNKSFDTPSSGLTTVTVCMDCGNLASDLCAADVRGSRVQRVQVASGTAPDQTCTCHVAVQWCTEGDAVATEFCPADMVVEKSAVDYTRSGVAASAGCRDAQYFLSALQGDDAKCQVHTEATTARIRRIRIIQRIRMIQQIPIIRQIRRIHRLTRTIQQIQRIHRPTRITQRIRQRLQIRTIPAIRRHSFKQCGICKTACADKGRLCRLFGLTGLQYAVLFSDIGVCGSW